VRAGSGAADPDAPRPLRLVPLVGMPEIVPGAPLDQLLRTAAERSRVALTGGVLVVCQKVCSKAEGRLVRLADVTPSAQAERIAREDGRDPRHVEVILRETARVVRRGPGVLVCETRHGFVCANAGVDLSNAPAADVAVLLPEDPDASARRLRAALATPGSEPPAVIVSDTFGRPFREGFVDVALGCAGLAPLDDRRGGRDRAGRTLQVTAMALADQLAAAAGLLMVKDAGVPAVWIEGITVAGDGDGQALLRPRERDLFRQ